jgi:hypothetical protein
MLAGRWAATSGTARNTAAKAARAAGGRQSTAPRAAPMTAVTVRYNDAPITYPSTPGSVSEIAEPPREDSSAVATRNSAAVATRLTGGMKRPARASFELLRKRVLFCQ